MLPNGTPLYLNCITTYIREIANGIFKGLRESNSRTFKDKNGEKVRIPGHSRTFKDKMKIPGHSRTFKDKMKIPGHSRTVATMSDVLYVALGSLSSICDENHTKT